MVLLIDNYDSFTYNIFQYLAELGEQVEVFRNDALTTGEIEAMAPEALVISPGPCAPDDAGISCEAIERFAGRIPILGVCLGHQCIGQVFGGEIVVNYRLMHGKTSPIHHDGRTIFRGIPSPFEAVRYHSLVIDPPSSPDCLEVSARTDQDEIMGAAPRVPGRGRAVPSRVDHDPAGQTASAQLPGPGQGAGRALRQLRRC